MMRDVVLVDLDGGYPALALVRYTGLSAYSHDHVVVLHAVDQLLEGIRKSFRIGVHHKADFEEVGSHAHQRLALPE